MNKHVIRADHQEEGPEKLHLPDGHDTCKNGHDLIDENGHPTDSMAWDHKGRPKCADCEPADAEIFKMVMQANGLKDGDTCPNGHPLTPDTVTYKMRTESGKHTADIVCEECGEVVKPGIKKANPQHDQAKHEGFKQQATKYSEYQPEVHRFYMKRSAKDYRLRAKANSAGITPNVSESGEMNYDLHKILDHGVKAGHLKEGDEISFDHFIPLAAGGSHSPDNLVGTSKEFNNRKNDAMPSTHEARLFGMDHTIPAIQVLNPRNIGYLDENNQPPAAKVNPNDRNFHGYIRDDQGNITEKIEHKGESGSGALRSNNFTAIEGMPKRTYEEKGSEGGAERRMGPGKQSEVGTLRRVKFMDREGQAQKVDTTGLGSGVLSRFGVHRYDPMKPSSDDAKFKMVDSRHESERSKKIQVSGHEFHNGARNKNLQAHIDALVKNIGVSDGEGGKHIPGFDHSAQGHAFFHHTEKGTFVNPAVKAAMLRHVHVEGAKQALPAEIAQTHAAILGHPSQLKVAPEQHAEYINKLEQHTGKINFGTQPRSLFVDHPTDRTKGQIINPAIRRHVREHVRDQGGMRSAEAVKMKLAEYRPVTLRKANNGRVANMAGDRSGSCQRNNNLRVFVGQVRK